MDSEVFDLSQRAFDETERFAQYLLLNMFRTMGVFKVREESFDKDELKRRLRIVPEHSQLFDALLSITSNAGFIRLNGARVTATSALSDPELQRRLENLNAKREQLAQDYPQKEAHLNLLWACMQNAPRVLTGEMPATEVLFPNSSMELVSGIYKNNPSADYFNQFVVADLKAYVEGRLASLAESEKITILEVGAGTGGTTAAVFETLAPYASHLRYFYTDISGSFTQYGKKQYGTAAPYAEFKVLDVEREIESQGYEAGSCDVVIATNVLHATRNIRTTLGRVKSLLKTHGWLIVNEGTAAQNFATMTFGLLEGWWLFEDAENRLANSPLIGSDSWKRVLEDEGFGRVLVQGQLADGRGLGQNVIVAESNGFVRRKGPPIVSVREAAVTKPKPIAPTQRPQRSAPELAVQTVPAAITKSLPAVSVRSYVEKKIIEILADVLQLEPGELHLNTPYTNLGVDSILSVEIVNRLNAESGINLRSTDLFNYATIRALSEHVIETFGANINFLPDVRATEPLLLETTSVPALAVEHVFGDDQVPTSELEDLFASAPSQTESPELTRFEENAQFENRDTQKPLEIAVIGMAGRFPDASNVDEFWNNLASGRNSIREVSRWDVSRLYDPDSRVADKSYSKWAGLLSDIELFDPLFFNLSPKEAEMMDPRQRLFLEEVWKALEDAGYSDKELEGKSCGVFVGCGPGDYKQKIAESKVTPNPYIFTGNQNSILTARISYLLNLKGPSVPIDTACSSSLVAIHLACESIRNGAPK
jgi:acyl carrier protein/SAM-dependent methyltransferase